MADTAPTRGAALALTEEKSFLATGFGFLDEKRMLLAATLLRELAAWRGLRDAYAEAMARGVEAMKAAIGRHGFEGVQLYPVAPVERPPVGLHQTPLLGLGLFDEPETAWPAPAVTEGVDLSTEAEACRAAFAGLVPIALRMAARQSNVYRLLGEYRATERRARALENVLIPETTARLAAITEHLDEADQEEAIRIRNAAR